MTRKVIYFHPKNQKMQGRFEQSQDEEDICSISSINWNENDDEYSRAVLNKSKDKRNRDSSEGSYQLRAKENGGFNKRHAKNSER